MEVDSCQLSIEQRLACVEREIAEFKSLLPLTTPSADWLQKVTGSVTDEAAFREVLELGLRVANGGPSPRGRRRRAVRFLVDFRDAEIP